MNRSEGQQILDNEAKVLKNSVAFLNDLAGLKAPGLKNTILQDLTMTSPPRTDAPVQSAYHTLGRKIFFTGRLCSGKDFVAAKLGGKIIGFADPIYTLAEYLFNIKVTSTEGKDRPGVRKVLQTIGQWGRNEISDLYPLTIERAIFCQMIRSLAKQKAFQISGVDLTNFGLSPEIWIDGLLNRVESNQISERVIVTNCRFPNEYSRLIDGGWQHWHIVCSPATLNERLKARGLGPNSPEVKDFSEQMAQSLDLNLISKLQKPGGKLQVIWSDEFSVIPSKQIYLIDEFFKLPVQ